MRCKSYKRKNAAVYHYIKDRAEIFEISKHNVPLGATADNKYNSLKPELGKGNLLIMMSDGLPELQNYEVELYGYQRVHNSIIKAADLIPVEMDEYLKEEDMKRTSHVPLKDDITLAVIQF